jgi:4'-phosphopantetheinyl transferase
MTDWPNAEHALNAPEGCRLWLFDLRQPIDAQHWQACDAEEHARAGRFHFQRDAARYRASHAHMRRVLGRELGAPPDALRWRQGTYGKPHLLGHEGWHVNLSHSGDWALLGMSHGRRIGVDIECHKPSMEISSMARHHFSEEEQRALDECPHAEREALFYRVWVCKEACLKALGCGLMLEPRHIDTVWRKAWTKAPARLRGKLFAPIVHGLELPAGCGGGVQAAVALLGHDHASEEPGEGPDMDW